jgi:hypothetical protein
VLSPTEPSEVAAVIAVAIRSAFQITETIAIAPNTPTGSRSTICRQPTCWS